MVLIWINAHRSWIIAAIAFGIWAFAQFWYLRGDFARWRRRNRPHVWSADMATKTSTGATTKANH